LAVPVSTPVIAVVKIQALPEQCTRHRIDTNGPMTTFSLSQNIST
jgi:hypothetical protein